MLHFQVINWVTAQSQERKDVVGLTLLKNLSYSSNKSLKLSLFWVAEFSFSQGWGLPCLWVVASAMGLLLQVFALTQVSGNLKCVVLLQPNVCNHAVCVSSPFKAWVFKGPAGQLRLLLFTQKEGFVTRWLVRSFPDTHGTPNTSKWGQASWVLRALR